MSKKKVNCILLVDDNSADNYFNEYIIMHGDVCNQTKVALNGLEAIAYLKKAGEPNQAGHFPGPDIIFLDINMPRMNGFEFLEEYKKLDEALKSKVMIIMLTTSINPEDKVKALAYKEVNEFHTKPLSIEVVQEIIERHF